MTRTIAVSSVTALSFLFAITSADSSALYPGRSDLRAQRVHVSSVSSRPRGERASGFLGTASVPHRVYEREGLTRDPNACAVWGCVGNN